MQTFYFKILEVMPIGLTGIGQRSIHTNLIGKIVEGNITVGEAFYITMIDGSIQCVSSKYLAVGRRMVGSFTEVNKDDDCAITIWLHPSKAHLIDISQMIWADDTIH